jgi:UDP-glucose 4-epimerase
MATHLVTGGAGFIGSHLCERLLGRGDRVVAVDDFSTGSRANLAGALAHTDAFLAVDADICRADLEAIVAEHRPEVVLHLAAQSGVRPGLRDTARDAMVNVVGLVRVLDAAASGGVRKVIHAGSGGTIYGRPRTIPATERQRRGARPETPYGISKKVSEDYLRFYRRMRGLDFTFLAMANVYGPRQDPLGEAGVISIFGLQMLEGRRPTVFGSGAQTRDYVYVDDVVDAFLLAMDRGSGRVLNIASGEETSVLRIFELLAAGTGAAGGPLFGPSPGDDLPRIALDPSRAARILGWRAKVPLPAGIDRTLEWLRASDETRRPRII